VKYPEDMIAREPYEGQEIRSQEGKLDSERNVPVSYLGAAAADIFIRSLERTQSQGATDSHLRFSLNQI
jgi:hypothetical protein